MLDVPPYDSEKLLGQWMGHWDAVKLGGMGEPEG